MDHRDYFVDDLRALSGLEESEALIRVLDAFYKVSREDFAGKGPWKLRSPLTGFNAVITPDDDPRRLYNSALIVLDEEKGINIGSPALWANVLARANIKPDASILQVGTGTGYYTAILSEIADQGHVLGLDVESGSTEKAKQSFKGNSRIEIRLGNAAKDLKDTDGPFDFIISFAGVTHPADIWLDKLTKNGRLLLPITGTQGWGAMVLIENGTKIMNATTLGRVGFYPCDGARSEQKARQIDEMWKDYSRLDGWGLKLIRTDNEVIYEVDGKRF